MNSIYSKIEITKALQDVKEIITYSIIKDELYGIKITKAEGNTIKNTEEVIMRDIFDSEEDVKKLIDSIIENSTDLSQIEYYVEDSKKLLV